MQNQTLENKLLPYKFQNIPQPIRMQINIFRAKKYWKRTGVIFIHIPKNGGTSVNNALYGRFMGHYSVSDIAVLNKDFLSNLPTLAISRNPWTRLYSAYSFAQKESANTLNSKIHNAKLYNQNTFDSFERFVNEWLVYQDIRSLDQIFRPQIDFIKRQDNVIAVNHIGMLERPETYTSWLQDNLGNPVQIQHLNKSEPKVSYRKAYNNELIDTVSKIYAEDLSFFNYDF